MCNHLASENNFQNSFCQKGLQPAEKQDPGDRNFFSYKFNPTAAQCTTVGYLETTQILVKRQENKYRFPTYQTSTELQEMWPYFISTMGTFNINHKIITFSMAFHGCLYNPIYFGAENSEVQNVVALR